MMKIVLDAGYHGYVGIEWEGAKPGEMEGVRLTKQLLERVRDKLALAEHLIQAADCRRSLGHFDDIARRASDPRHSPFFSPA